MKLFILRCIHFVLRHIVSLDEIIYSTIEQMHKKQERILINSEIGFKNKNKFWQNIKVITHAGGGLQGLDYLNCKEAFRYYYMAGNRVFEYDVERLYSGEYIISHNKGFVELIDGRFSPITLDNIIENLKIYEDIIVVFDCKFREKGCFLEKILPYIEKINALNRVIIQVFDEEDIQSVQKVWKNKMIYVCLYNTDYNEAVHICLKNKIYAVSISEKAIKERKGWEIFNEKNICTFVYTINTVKEYSELI